MTDHEWQAHFEAEAHARGDWQRLRLVALGYEADLHRETAPDQMLALIDEARRLASALDEPWWLLFYDDRRAGALMKYKGDVKAGLEQAVRNALEARKPLYEQFPWRFRIHDHLIVGYLNTDPVGYAERILEALDWLERTKPTGGSPKYLVLARRRWLVAELGQVDEAESLARQGLALAASDPDTWTARSHAVFCYSHLCEIAWQRRDLAALADSAHAGEDLAQQTSHLLEQAEFGTWLAVLARQRGERNAANLFRQACRRAASLGMPPDHIYFDAVCAYHGLGDEWHDVVETRRRELALLVGRDRYHAETRCRILLCRGLQRLGQALDEELASARETAQKLRRPEPALAELDRMGCMEG